MSILFVIIYKEMGPEVGTTRGTNSPMRGTCGLGGWENMVGERQTDMPFIGLWRGKERRGGGEDNGRREEEERSRSCLSKSQN